MTSYNCPKGCNVGCEVCANNHYEKDNNHNLTYFNCNCICHKLKGKDNDDYLLLAEVEKKTFIKNLNSKYNMDIL